MKKSYKKDVHIGEQPIRILKHNLNTRLVVRNQEYIKQLQNDFKLNKHIKYNIKSSPLIENQCPFIDDKGIINIHETYLSFIWIICYYFFVSHEELLVIPESKKRGLFYRKEQNLDLVNKAKDLFDYGMSLIKVFSIWDKDILPNPEFYDENTEQGWYILRTNDIFVETLNFILYHETAHAEYEHINKIKLYNLTEEQQKHIEIEADTRAIELILSNKRDNQLSELSIVVGLASILFFKNNLSGGSKHPDINLRLENAIKTFHTKNESPIWSMLSLFIKVWTERFSIKIKQKEFYNNYKELYYDLLNQVK